MISDTVSEAFGQDLTTQADDMEQLANLYRLQAVLNLMQKNVLLLKNPINQQTLNVAGGDLFKIATQVYGDATQWTQIAQANGLVDPLITGLATLIIPPLSPSKSGGILGENP